MGKKFKYGTTSLIDILLIAGILVLINIFSIGEFRRVDLTQNREYTISPATKKILSELDDIVNVKFFISEQLPPQFLTIKRQITDMMDEFQAFSNSNFRLKYIDPKEEPRYKQEADMAGIPEVSVKVMEEDEFRVMQAYLGILIEHENKMEAIPVITGVENLEYDLMSRIVKVLQKDNELSTIGILQGHGEPSTKEGNQQTGEQPGELGLFVKAMREQFKAFDVNLDNRNEIPSTVDTLVVVNPGSIPDNQLYAIDQFVMGGGKLVCFVNGVEGFDNLNEPAQPFASGINELLAHYGIKVNSDLILDQNCETAEFRTGQMSYMRKQYPFWVKVKRENLDKTSPITANFESVTIHWPSSLDILKDKLGDVQATVLAKSSDKSWLMKSDFNTSPMQDFNVLPTGDQFNIAVLLDGSFKSYFDGKPHPTQSSDNPTSEEQAFKAISAPTQIVVFGTMMPLMSHMWAPNQMRQNETQTIIRNMFDYLNVGDELIGIRSRQTTNRPLNEEMIKSNHQRAIIRYSNIFAVPLLVIIVGIVRFVLRRGRKKRFEREFKAKHQE